jgi:hypothetical protein
VSAGRRKLLAAFRRQRPTIQKMLEAAELPAALAEPVLMEAICSLSSGQWAKVEDIDRVLLQKVRRAIANAGKRH